MNNTDGSLVFSFLFEQMKKILDASFLKCDHEGGQIEIHPFPLQVAELNEIRWIFNSVKDIKYLIY